MHPMNATVSISSEANLWTTLEANHELLDKIFISCLVSLIMVANVLMGCEVVIIKIKNI
jgi:hypothetical protein